MSLMNGCSSYHGSLPMSFNNNNNADSYDGSTLLQPRQPLRCRSGTRPPTPAPLSIAALDSHSTKLHIPLSAVEPTMALEDDGLVPGICRLFLKGQCRQGDRCFQVHASPIVVEQLRQEALRAPSCCHDHGAACNFEGFPLGLTVTLQASKDTASSATPAAEVKSENGNNSNANNNNNNNSSHHAESYSNGDAGSNGNNNTNMSNHNNNNTNDAPAAARGTMISLHSLCPTNYLWSLYKASGDMHLTAPMRKICREHRKGLCRFGDECSFLHICRQVKIDRVAGDDEAGTPLLRADHRHSQSQHGSYSSFHHHHSSSQITGSMTAHYQQHSSVNGHSVPDSFSFSGQRPSLHPQQQQQQQQQSGSMASNNGRVLMEGGPLLRPLGAVAVASSYNNYNNNNNSNSLSTPHRANSFTHNPYADASSFNVEA